MRIGVISEGHSDRAVITNIILGITGLDKSHLIALRPIDTLDETDKAIRDPKTFSTWSLVKKECEKRELIDGFLAIEGQDFIALHLDTAEAEQYGIKRPGDKSLLRDLVVNQVNSWLKKDLANNILYAIAIEETDAWILTIYDKHDSTTSAKPKEKLSRILGKIGIGSTVNFDNYLKISKPLSKRKEVEREKYLSFNYSLEAFYKEVEEKVVPKLQTPPA
jgi:hypothetical protein